MTITVALRHSTRYEFDRAVTLTPHVLRLRPAPHCRTPVKAYSLNVRPEKHFINWQQDPFGNYLARLVFPEQSRSLEIDVEVIADLVIINPFDFFLEEYAENFPFGYPDTLAHNLGPYLEITERGPLLEQWLRGVDRDKTQSVGFLVDLNQRLQQDVKYLIRLEPGVQTCEDTLARASGSCRDSAWLLVQILRHLGLAARFVSGYLVQLVADVKPVHGPAGPTEDFTDLHAWAEVYLPGAGWIGLDPTSGLFAGEGHLPLACTPDPADAAPVSGATDPCETRFTWSNRVERIHEKPRVTRPFSESTWQAIVTLGEQVDEELAANDVRLTMGGEPTFVSMDDMEGEEWNTAALGKEKLRIAEALARRLRQHFAPCGIFHHGAGKWYPGEPLPRWALSVFWRSDGKELWRDEQWLAGEDTDLGHGLKQAERFINALCTQLGLDRRFVVCGYEDVYHGLWREGNLPANVDPFDSKLGDPLERERLRHQFEQGLDKPAGYALPIKFSDAAGWISSPWPFRRGRMYLTPGDSPMGLRLPLQSLPWQLPQDRQQEPELDPFAPRDALPDRGVLPERTTGGAETADQQDPGQEVLHTALCVQARHGRLYVFLPPLTRLEHFVELITALETVAEKLSMPVILEGYEPPRDPRLHMLQLTPDPGVLEVNVHPSSSWKDLLHTVETLYEEARQVRLATEKFMLDGGHGGTGGGNHVTLGGPTATDSPLLRRPDLLRSLISYWQNHPSLSYLFSGRFIGPTSQAPRVDEARDDNLYELEIALKLLPEGVCEQPWLVDRILRNFLVDLTGNTHRAEFCIDKLYSPDTPGGRRGLLEFRGFEMPPHWRMSALQMLLLRAMIARFWKRPVPVSLIRWGTELHDRFMLPFYVWQDFVRVIEDMQNEGYNFDGNWFRSFHEFRFPVHGSVQIREMEVELRAAIEPWHVLGEESSVHGTSRYVDSSVERLQVRVSGMPARGFLLTCNRRPVPLRPTDTRGEFIAGVRYKAWAPPSSLHPTIKPHSPLVFDLVDTTNKRSIGGCTYHVSHPGGRNFKTFPVNANEAEGRRLARFWPHGHTTGKIRIHADAPSPEHPYMLDLRMPRRR